MTDLEKAQRTALTLRRLADHRAALLTAQSALPIGELRGDTRDPQAEALADLAELVLGLYADKLNPTL